jgi:hypothetical protein
LRYNPFPENRVCDRCNQQTSGVFVHCVTCEDYDLCLSCAEVVARRCAPHTSSSPTYSWEINLQISESASQRVEFVKSPSHALNVREGEVTGRPGLLVGLKGGKVIPERDFFLLIAYKDFALPRMVVEKLEVGHKVVEGEDLGDSLMKGSGSGKSSYCALVNLIPSFNSATLAEAYQQYVAQNYLWGTWTKRMNNFRLRSQKLKKISTLTVTSCSSRARRVSSRRWHVKFWR